MRLDKDVISAAQDIALAFRTHTGGSGPEDREFGSLILRSLKGRMDTQHFASAMAVFIFCILEGASAATNCSQSEYLDMVLTVLGRLEAEADEE